MMNEHRKFITLIGGRNIAARKLGLSLKSIDEAIRKKKFPSYWYDLIDHLGAERGVPVNRDLFNFKKPCNRAKVHEETKLMPQERLKA